MQRPCATIATRSHTCSTSARMWLDTNTVRPSAANSRISVRTSRMPGGSRPFAGSSRIEQLRVLQQRGRDAEPLLHAERVRREPRVGARRRARPGRASRRRASGRCRACRPSSSRLRRPVKFGKNDGCSTSAPTRSIVAGEPGGARRTPSSRIRPRAPRSRPTAARIAVVLPAPLAPRNPNTPPSGTVEVEARRARSPGPAGSGTPPARRRTRSPSPIRPPFAGSSVPSVGPVALPELLVH